MQTKLHLDFETRSVVDLKKYGLDRYAANPTTDIWCAGFAFDREPTDLLTYEDIHAGPRSVPGSRIAQHVAAGGIVVAHNAFFEWALWNSIMVRLAWPTMAIEQMRCTMAMAYAMSLPGALDRAAPAAGLAVTKDPKGYQIMLQMCKPRSGPDTACTFCKGAGYTMLGACTCVEWWDTPEKRAKLYAYCRQDVVVERALDERLAPLSDEEQSLWCLDHKINTRGVCVDRTLVEKSAMIARAEQYVLDERMRRVTGGHVGYCSEVARLTKWVVKRGVAIEGIAKSDIVEALARPDLPADVREALMIRREAGRTSTAKLDAMKDFAGDDSRLRYMLQFHGAGTGRWAGRKVQLHNLVRPKMSAEALLGAIDIIKGNGTSQASAALRFFYDVPMEIIPQLMRGMLVAGPGNEFWSADFANIESRALAWLSGEEWKLEAFRLYDTYLLDSRGNPIPDGKGDFKRAGPDLYLVAAGKVYGIDPMTIDKKDIKRQHGKVVELACGYQGGVGALDKMAKTYLVKIPQEFKRPAVYAWREGHPMTQQYWRDLEYNAKEAVRQPGTIHRAGPARRAVTFRMSGSFLWCLLPSGRVTCYPYPWLDRAYTVEKDGYPIKLSQRRVQEEHLQFGVDGDGSSGIIIHGEVCPILRQDDDVLFYKCVDGETGKWTETDTYGGKLSENVTQALCRDLLVAAMWNCEAAGYPVVLHVHDEIVSEVPIGRGNLADFEYACSKMPPIFDGLPVVAKGWHGARYKKE